MLKYLALVVAVAGSRVYLPSNRVPKWKTADPNYGPDYGQPEQIHLSLGASPSEMVVTWLTFDDTEKSLVNFGLITDKKPGQVVEGKCTEFIGNRKSKTKRFIHRVTLTGLVPGNTYQYRVGSEYGWSALYKFTAMTPRSDGVTRLLCSETWATRTLDHLRSCRGWRKTATLTWFFTLEILHTIWTLMMAK